MELEVYADVLFLVNFSMDFLTLYLCAQLCCRPFSPWRALGAAALGAAYAVAALFWAAELPTALALALDIPVCLLLCAIGLWRGGERPRVLLRLGAIYLLISALLGGVMTLLSTLLNRTVSDGALSAQPQESMTFALFSIAAPLAAGGSVLLSRLHRRALSRRTVRIRIVEGDRSVSLRALCDSGNLLHDPLSARPVIPVANDAVQALLPPPLRALLTAPHPAAQLPTLPDPLRRRTRLIPAKGATGERLLLAFAVEHLYVEDGHGVEREVCAYIAPSSLPAAHEYAAILPAALLVH